MPTELENLIRQAVFRMNPTLRDQPAAPTVPNYGLRTDLTPKANGYFGPLQRPDGYSSTELSTGVNFGQGEMLIPLLNPLLNQEEVRTLLAQPPNEKVPKPILDKAVSFAKQRLSLGLSPFATNEEIPYGIKQ